MLMRAMEMIETHILKDAVRSSLWLTEPVGFLDQAHFINAAIVGYTVLPVVKVHQACKEIEQSLGRTQRERWREREIDIDIILAGTDIVAHDELHVPHVHMHERRFVLAPSAEIAPDMIYPHTGQTIADLLAVCADTSAVKKVD